MIPMTEMDVQQVRDAVKAAKQAQKPSGPGAPAQTKALATPMLPYHHVEEAKKKREGMTRDERLGLR